MRFPPLFPLIKRVSVLYHERAILSTHDASLVSWRKRQTKMPLRKKARRHQFVEKPVQDSHKIGRGGVYVASAADFTTGIQRI